MEYKFEKAREAISKGNQDRASLLIGELEKETPYTVNKNSWFKEVRGTYGNKALHETEKMYTHGLITSLMSRATAEGDFNTINLLNEMYRLSNKNSMNFRDSVAFSKKVFDMYENSKFMPIKNAVNQDNLYEMVMNKNKKVSDFSMPNIPINKFIKGGISGVLGVVNDVKNVGASVGYTGSKLARFEKGRQLFEKLSKAEIDIFKDDPDAESYVFVAGKVAPLIAQILYSGGSSIASKAPAFTKEFTKQFSIAVGKGAVKAGTVIGLSEVAGKVAKDVANTLEFDEPNVRGVESSARLATMKVVHDWFVTPSEQIEAERNISDKLRKITDNTKKVMRETVKENSEALKRVMSDNNIGKSSILGRVEPIVDPSADNVVQTSNKPSSIGLPEFVNEKTGNTHTVNDLVKYDPEMQSNGFVKTSPIPDSVEYKPFAVASLDNSIVSEVKAKSNGGYNVPEVSAQDVMLFVESFNPESFDQLQLGAISRDSNNINIPQLLDHDTASELFKIKTIISKKDKGVFDSLDSASRTAILEQWANMSGFDKTISGRFFGIVENPNLPAMLSAEEKGDIAVSVHKLSKALFDRNKSSVYMKFNPILDKFDVQDSEYVSNSRSSILKTFDKLINDPDLRNGWEKIASSAGLDTTLYFDTVEGNQVATGSFPNAIRGLISGQLDDGNSISFYQGLKQARSVLSRNNPFKYQTPVPESAYTDPNKVAFATIRKNIIDPIYKSMVKVTKEMLTPEQRFEYAEGEKYFKGIKEKELGVIEDVMNYNINKKGSNPEALYDKFYKKPQILSYLQKIGNTTGDLPVSDEWLHLQSTGSVDEGSTPFIAMQTALVLESLSGMLRASGDKIHESFARFKENINAPTNLRGSKLNELLNPNQRKAFDLLVKNDSKQRKIRLDAETDKFFQKAIVDDIINPKNSASFKAFILTLLKKNGFKPFLPFLKALHKEMTAESRADKIRLYMNEMSSVIKGNLLTKDAVRDSISKNKGR